jgi:hypothetical protein
MRVRLRNRLSSCRVAMGRIKVQLAWWPNNLSPHHLRGFDDHILRRTSLTRRGSDHPATRLQKQKHDIRARICISSGDPT